MALKAAEWIMDSGCTNHMTSDRCLLMDSTLHPCDKSHITFVDTSKSNVLGRGRVAISKDQHMDKVMLVESLGFNLMSVSMLCDLNMIVLFGKYRWLVLMESDKSLVFEGYQKEYGRFLSRTANGRMSSSKSFRVLALASKARACWHEELAHSREEEACCGHRRRQVQEGSFVWRLRSWKDDKSQAYLKDYHDHVSTLRAVAHGLIWPYSLLHSQCYCLPLWLRHC